MEMKIPKEIQSKESPFIKGLSIRQCILLVIGIVVAGLMYFLVLRPYNLGDSAIPISAICAAPFFAFAFYRKHGMLLRNYFINFVSDKFLSAKNRRTSYDNLYEKWAALGAPVDTKKKAKKSRFKATPVK